LLLCITFAPETPFREPDAAICTTDPPLGLEVTVNERSRERYQPLPRQGLYDPANEHDACGLGFIAHIKGQKRHAIVTQALSILKNLSHRGATGADPLQGDGAGILIQLPDRFLRRVCGAQGLTLPAI